LALLAVCVIAHAAAFTSLWFEFLDPFFIDTDRGRRGIDFYSVYQSGDAILDGRSIYDPNVPAGVVPYVTGVPFRYLPFAAYAIALPLNAIPPRGAYWTWVAAMEVLLVVNASVSAWITPDRRWKPVAAAVWFVFTPYYVELYVGQWSFLMATLTLWAGALLARGHAASAGVWATSVMVKMMTALLAPAFFRAGGGWRPLVVSAGVVAVLNAPYFALEPDALGDFWRINFEVYFDAPPIRPFGFVTGDLGFARLLRVGWLHAFETSDGPPASLTLSIAALVAAISAWATWSMRRDAVARMFAVWTCVYFLLAQGTWEHQYVLMLPTLALLVALDAEMRVLALVVFVLIALPTPYWLFERYLGSQNVLSHVPPELAWPPWAGMALHASKAVPVAWLWASICWQAVSERNMTLPRRV
jgi:hypothetical protein